MQALSNFSVLMSVYEKEIPEYFDNAIKSIINQTHPPTEIVIVKDGQISEDLEAVISNNLLLYADLFKIVSLKKNMGLGIALNEGLKACSHEIIARMDTDDIALPKRFEKQVVYLQTNTDIAVVGTSMEEFNALPGDLKKIRQLPPSYRELLVWAKFRNPLNHPSVMFRKSILKSVGAYQNLLLFEDYFLWLTLLKRGYKIANISECLLYFRTNPKMIERRHGLNYAKKELRFLRASYDLNFINLIEFIGLIVLRIPLRLIPKQMLNAIYKLFLRKNVIS